MSKTPESCATSAPLRAGPETSLLIPVDWFLQSLVSYADNWGVETAITLQVSGLLVSGVVMPAAKYLDEIAVAYRDSCKANPEIGKRLSLLIASYKTLVEPPEGADEEPFPQFIHLRDTRFFTPGKKLVPASGSTLWRGRIAEVGGFTLGALTTA